MQRLDKGNKDTHDDVLVKCFIYVLFVYGRTGLAIRGEEEAKTIITIQILDHMLLHGINRTVVKLLGCFNVPLFPNCLVTYPHLSHRVEEVKCRVIPRYRLLYVKDLVKSRKHHDIL